MPPGRHPGARHSGLLAAPGLPVLSGPLERERAHGPAQPSCPSSPWQPWGSQKLLKPWKCFGPGARELAGAPRRGRKSPGCSGVEWTQHTHSLTTTHTTAAWTKTVPLPASATSACAASLPTCCRHFLGNGEKTSFLGSSATVVAALASGSLGHGVGGRAGNCLLSTWALCTGVAHRAAPGHGGKGCGLLNDRAGALLLLVLRTVPLGDPLRLESTVSKCGKQRGQSPQLVRDWLWGEEVEVRAAKKQNLRGTGGNCRGNPGTGALPPPTP